MPDRLKGRRILITGAASGIGRRTAELFAAEGAALTLLDCDRKRLASVARETGGTAVEADVTQEPSVTHAVEQGASTMGGIDGVVRVYRQQKGGGRAVLCWAGVGADSSLRVVIAQYPSTTTSAALIGDMINRLSFDVRQK